MLISEAFELYRIEHIVYLNQSRRTEEMHECAYKCLISFLGSDMPVENLTFELIRKWKVELEKKRSSTTARGYIIKLRVVIKHLNLRKIEGVIDHNMIGIPRKAQAQIEFLTEDEVRSMLYYCRTCKGATRFNRLRNSAIVALLYASGIRLSEMRSLDIGSIREDGTFTVVGKGNKPRLCFTDKRARKYITDYLKLRSDNDRALFITAHPVERISAGTVQLIIKNAAKGAGIERHITPHTLRHSFATNLLRNNTNLMYVKNFLGHESVQTTEMYTHVVNEDLRNIYVEKHTI